MKKKILTKFWGNCAWEILCMIGVKDIWKLIFSLAAITSIFLIQHLVYSFEGSTLFLGLAKQAARARIYILSWFLLRAADTNELLEVLDKDTGGLQAHPGQGGFVSLCFIRLICTCYLILRNCVRNFGVWLPLVTWELISFLFDDWVHWLLIDVSCWFTLSLLFRYFSYEHFYVIYCIFWELDTDHDFLIDKENLIRYGNHALTYRIIGRIFSQVRICYLILYASKTCIKLTDIGAEWTSIPKHLCIYY